jgi:hypothetical protein
VRVILAIGVLLMFAAPAGAGVGNCKPAWKCQPTPSVVPTNVPPSDSGAIYMGVFEDTGNYWTDTSRFSAMIDDVRAHNMDSTAWVNGRLVDNLPLATIADQRSYPILSSWFQANLAEDWWPDSVPATIDRARQVIGPLVDQLKVHQSVIGYNLIDDANMDHADKIRLAEQVVREHDTHPSSPTLVWSTLGRDVYTATQGDVFLFYDYPAKDDNIACSWVDFWVDELRLTKSTKPASVPVWQVLQAHETPSGGGSLRYPTVEEMRMQVWIALGEETKGLWWFTYTAQGQPWTGLRDSPVRYVEATALAARVNGPNEALLGSLRKVGDAYHGSGLYISTMTAGTKTYLVPVNKSCSAWSAAITGSYSQLRDVETGATYSQGQAISFRGGDGHLLEVIP